MKLRHIVPSLQAEHGGPSKSVRALCAALARPPHEVELLATDPAVSAAGHALQEDRLTLKFFRRDWPRRLSCSAGLRRAAQEGRVDIIHHHALWLRTLHYAHRAAVGQQAKLVISPRGMMSQWAWNHRRGRKQIATQFVHPGALAGADGWHATSEAEKSEIQALGFDQPICVAPNGIDAPSPAVTAQAAEHWRLACPALADRRVALFYSRFHSKKRVLELIDLWLRRAPRDWVLLLVGIAQDYTPEMLERYAQRLSGAGRVFAFSGYGQPSPYAIASLFLLPSHNENFGLVIAEAMASGVPVLVTDSTPWRAINDEKVGWCVPWEDYASALQAAAAETPAELHTRGAAAKTWVLRNFSWDRTASLLLDFYAALPKRCRG